MAILIVSPVSAAPNVRLSSVTFNIGSLIANGYISGLGNTDVNVTLSAGGNASVICTNPGKNDVPGQSYPKVSASGQVFMPGNSDTRTKNGKTPFSNVETQDPQTVPWDLAGCPNSGWTARVVSISWTNATVYVSDLSENTLTSQDYVCDPTLQTATKAYCNPTK